MSLHRTLLPAAFLPQADAPAQSSAPDQDFACPTDTNPVVSLSTSSGNVLYQEKKWGPTAWTLDPNLNLTGKSISLDNVGITDIKARIDNNGQMRLNSIHITSGATHLNIFPDVLFGMPGAADALRDDPNFKLLTPGQRQNGFESNKPQFNAKPTADRVKEMQAIIQTVAGEANDALMRIQEKCADHSANQSPAPLDNRPSAVDNKTNAAASQDKPLTARPPGNIPQADGIIPGLPPSTKIGFIVGFGNTPALVQLVEPSSDGGNGKTIKSFIVTTSDLKNNELKKGAPPDATTEEKQAVLGIVHDRMKEPVGDAREALWVPNSRNVVVQNGAWRVVIAPDANDPGKCTIDEFNVFHPETHGQLKLENGHWTGSIIRREGNQAVMTFDQDGLTPLTDQAKKTGISELSVIKGQVMGVGEGALKIAIENAQNVIGSKEHKQQMQRLLNAFDY